MERATGNSHQDEVWRDYDVMQSDGSAEDKIWRLSHCHYPGRWMMCRRSGTY